MDAESPIMRKYPIENIINDATGILKKNGNRKAILMLDKHFISYSQQDLPIVNIQLSRRLMNAAQHLMLEYLSGENIAKTDLLLDRCNLYFAIAYINIQKLLKYERTLDTSFEGGTNQLGLKPGLNKVRQKIRQSICIPGSLIKPGSLNKLKESHKIKFYINECWMLMIKQLVLYSKLFRITNEFSNSVKMMRKAESIIQIKEFRNTKNIELLKRIISHFSNSGQLYFQVCEFKQSIKQYEIALNYLQQLIFLQFKKKNTPNIIDPIDLKPVEQYFKKIILILYMQSLSYEYLSQYSKMKECIHLACWLCSELLRLDENHQLRILIFSRAQDIQRYLEQLLAENEIKHLIFTILNEENQQEYTSLALQAKEEFETLINDKLYLKFQQETLNKQQYIKIIPISLRSSSPIQFYNVPKGSRTEREITTNQISKNYQSFTTQDGNENNPSKKLLTCESEMKLKKDTSQSTFSRRSRPTDYSKYCKTESTDYPKLDQELAQVIVHKLQSEKSFFALSDIKKNFQDEIITNYKQQQEEELGKAILKFKNGFNKNQFYENKEVDSLRFINNEIKTEFQLISGYLEAQETLKKKKQQQKLLQNAQNTQQQPLFKKSNNPFRKILIKHSNTLKLKQAKKILQQKEEESALMKLYNQISECKEQEKEKVDDQRIMKKMMQSNLNAIKVIMDDNQKEQIRAQTQLKQRRHISEQLFAKSEISPKNQIQFKDLKNELANSTQYLSAKGSASKNVISIVELANIKRKMNQLEAKKTVRYSELFKSQL